MTLLGKYKTLMAGLVGFLLATLIFVSCTFDVGTEPGDVSQYSCTRLKAEYGDGQEMAAMMAAGGKSFLQLIKEDTGDSFMGRFFMDMLVWDSGSRENAERRAKDGFYAHLDALERELVARCS